MTWTKEQAAEMGRKSSRKGVPNRSTIELKEAFKDLLDGSIDKIHEWLEEVAENNPARAIELTLKMAEYVIPKKKTPNLRGITVEQLLIMPQAERTKYLEDVSKELFINGSTIPQLNSNKE